MSVANFPKIEHIAPVLIVDRVEPCVAFWVDRFGFDIKHEVPGQDGSVFFASVVRDGIEIMYQTRASVLAEDPQAAKDLAGRSAVLYFTVPDLGAVERAIAGAAVVKPTHRTPYGSTEVYVREPGGHTIGFAQV
jgi:uncharacterized glyoxalase superfamily protein PhnB